jgi:hypothetical protein
MYDALIVLVSGIVTIGVIFTVWLWIGLRRIDAEAAEKAEAMIARWERQWAENDARADEMMRQFMKGDRS